MGGFDEMRKVADVFGGYARPWFIAGGWASDLFLGRVTREHEDVDVAVLRPDQFALREHLRAWDVGYATRTCAASYAPGPPDSGWRCRSMSCTPAGRAASPRTSRCF